MAAAREHEPRAILMRVCVTFLLFAAVLVGSATAAPGAASSAPSPSPRKSQGLLNRFNLWRNKFSLKPPAPTGAAAATGGAVGGAAVAAAKTLVTPAATGTCQASTLAGYTSSVDLSGNGLILHWKTSTGSTIDLALEAKSTSGAAGGWIAVAWSNGGMFNSDAVIGNLATASGVGTYAISSYSNVVTTTRFAITGTSVTASGGSTIAKFTRATGDGLVKVNAAGSNNLVWAYSSGGSKTVANHGGSHRCRSARPLASFVRTDLPFLVHFAQIKSGVLLHWKRASATQLDMAVELKSSSGASNGWFSRTANTGSQGMKMSGVSRLIWAHSNSNSKSLAFHGGADPLPSTEAPSEFPSASLLSLYLYFHLCFPLYAHPSSARHLSRWTWAFCKTPLVCSALLHLTTLSFSPSPYHSLYRSGYMSVDFSCATAPSSGGGGGGDGDGDGDGDHEGGGDHDGDSDDGFGGGGSGAGSAFLSQLIAWLGSLFGFRK
ncbi:unnamed protein product [Closterium sp. Naga37s-1]|nr:unnamed protein product [Closterium sp. Naga37s-1]